MDVLAGPVSPKVFETGSQPMDSIRISFGGDALNEAVALSKLGVSVELISKVGQDEAGERILEYLKKYNVSTECIVREEGLDTGVNIVLIDEAGERHFLTNPEGSLRKLSREDVEPYLTGTADIVSFASMFVSPLMTIPKMKELFTAIKKQGKLLAVDMTKANFQMFIRSAEQLPKGVQTLLFLLFSNMLPISMK
jgi:sugar/nucleoside kinase (ribokinase family)